MQPDIKGQWSWIDDKTLRFVPAADWPVDIDKAQKPNDPIAIDRHATQVGVSRPPRIVEQATPALLRNSLAHIVEKEVDDRLDAGELAKRFQGEDRYLPGHRRTAVQLSCVAPPCGLV